MSLNTLFLLGLQSTRNILQPTPTNAFTSTTVPVQAASTVPWFAATGANVPMQTASATPTFTPAPQATSHVPSLFATGMTAVNNDSNMSFSPAVPQTADIDDTITLSTTPALIPTTYVRNFSPAAQFPVSTAQTVHQNTTDLSTPIAPTICLSNAGVLALAQTLTAPTNQGLLVPAILQNRSSVGLVSYDPTARRYTTGTTCNSSDLFSAPAAAFATLQSPSTLVGSKPTPSNILSNSSNRFDLSTIPVFSTNYLVQATVNLPELSLTSLPTPSNSSSSTDTDSSSYNELGRSAIFHYSGTHSPVNSTTHSSYVKRAASPSVETPDTKRTARSTNLINTATPHTAPARQYNLRQRSKQSIVKSSTKVAVACKVHSPSQKRHAATKYTKPKW